MKTFIESIFTNPMPYVISFVIFFVVACVFFAVLPDIIKRLSVRRKPKREPKVSGAIITFEAAVARPFDANKKDDITALYNEILDNGFDNYTETIRFCDAVAVYRKKYLQNQQI